jgi:transposase-like protein
MDKLDDMTTEERLLYWRMIMDEYEESGLQRIDYCRKNDIALSTFDYWKRRLRETEQEGSGEDTRLVEIKLNESDREITTHHQSVFNTELLITYNDLELHINSSTPMALLKQVVEGLRYA